MDEVVAEVTESIYMMKSEKRAVQPTMLGE
jgi:hypothetical protein